jgi:hypothetical protein
MMLLALRHYALNDHVLTDKIDDTTYWYHYDRIVLTWMLGTLSFELQDIISEPFQMAQQAWLAIEAHFLINGATHVHQLDERFHAFRQGDYCHKIKGMANMIHSLGELFRRNLVLHVFKSVRRIVSLADRYINLGNITGNSGNLSIFKSPDLPAKSPRSQKNDT